MKGSLALAFSVLLLASQRHVNAGSELIVGPDQISVSSATGVESISTGSLEQTVDGILDPPGFSNVSNGVSVDSLPFAVTYNFDKPYSPTTFRLQGEFGSNGLNAVMDFSLTFFNGPDGTGGQAGSTFTGSHTDPSSVQEFDLGDARYVDVRSFTFSAISNQPRAPEPADRGEYSELQFLQACPPDACGGGAPTVLAPGISNEPLMEDFTGGPGGALSVFDGNGVSIAERFVGLTVVDPGGGSIEFFEGTPGTPLALETSGTASSGILLCCDGLVGLAGSTGADDLGEGVIALLFDYDVRNFGLTLLTDAGGTTTFTFFDEQAAEVDSITTILSGDLSFSSTEDFRGVAISSTDRGGISIGELRFSQAMSIDDEGGEVRPPAGLLWFITRPRLYAEDQ